MMNVSMGGNAGIDGKNLYQISMNKRHWIVSIIVGDKMINWLYRYA